MACKKGLQKNLYESPLFPHSFISSKHTGTFMYAVEDAETCLFEQQTCLLGLVRDSLPALSKEHYSCVPQQLLAKKRCTLGPDELQRIATDGTPVRDCAKCEELRLRIKELEEDRRKLTLQLDTVHDLRNMVSELKETLVRETAMVQATTHNEQATTHNEQVTTHNKQATTNSSSPQAIDATNDDALISSGNSLLTGRQRLMHSAAVIIVKTEEDYSRRHLQTFPIDTLVCY
ncbi:uncharacterized protein LOC127536546 [Xyrichtys novacula]|uniref:Uncharacterized protein LOC127536546 n=1 Tax=Xyrichtys novacula TaxID=13765 RepID=A0AAV1FVZ6_XYRNO|nr:uncharacterized protein LOC127536546 [Xyrichtys novacula]